jgi:ATP-dependent Lon protease
VHIGREIEPVRSFRRAEIQLLHDFDSNNPALDAECLRQQLLCEFQRHLPPEAQTAENLQQILSEHIPLGALTDLVSYTMPMDMEIKRRLLEECCMQQRAQLLLEQLESQFASSQEGASASRVYPPRFSDN